MKTFLTCLVLIIIPLFSFATPESADTLATNGGLDSLERLIHDNLAFTRLDPASAMWNFLHGPVLPVLELILMLFAVVLILRSTVAKSAVPFVLAVVLQIYQTLMLGNDAVWWCLPENMGLHKAILGFIPVALYLVLEFNYVILVWTFSKTSVRIWPVLLAAVFQYFAMAIGYMIAGNLWIGLVVIYAIPLLMNGAKGGSSAVKDTLLLIVGVIGFMVTLSFAAFTGGKIVAAIVMTCPAAGIGLALLFKRLQNRDYTARQLPNGKWAVYNDVFDTHAQALRHIERMREQDKARDEQARRRNNR